MIAEDPGLACGKEAPARLASGEEQSRIVGSGLRKGLWDKQPKVKEGTLGGLKGDSNTAGFCPSAAVALNQSKDVGPLSRTAECQSTSLPPASVPSGPSVNKTASQTESLYDPPVPTNALTSQPAPVDEVSFAELLERQQTRESLGGNLKASGRTIEHAGEGAQPSNAGCSKRRHRSGREAQALKARPKRGGPQLQLRQPGKPIGQLETSSLGNVPSSSLYLRVVI